MISFNALKNSKLIVLKTNAKIHSFKNANFSTCLITLSPGSKNISSSNHSDTNIDDRLILLAKDKSLLKDNSVYQAQSVKPPKISNVSTNPLQKPKIPELSDTSKIEKFADELKVVNESATSRLTARRFAAAIEEEVEAPESMKKTASEYQSYMRTHLQKERIKELEKSIQTHKKLKESKDLYSQILRNFNAPIKYAYAYGSGVFKQANYSSSGSMVDMIFGVSHPEHWHSINIQQNPHHYSSLKLLGAGAVNFVQNKIGTGVYFNPYVEINGVKIKYGVASIDSLTNDLLTWKTLYLAGRMHKPTLVLQDDKFVRLCSQVNLASALRVALLMLPKNFTEHELFSKIVGISYIGDLRMQLGGENPKKIDNIVDAQIDMLRELYSSSIEGMSNMQYIGMNFLQQNMDTKVRATLFNKVPQRVYNQVKYQYNRSPKSLVNTANINSANLENMKLSEMIVSDQYLSEMTKSAIESIVKWPSFTQSVKGIVTAGFLNSYRYASEKRAKAKI
ncbi:hypothetical protein BB558_005092 [Smittium angustum]|uniref:Phosphatidate cytidylyltransferase, mitochondrial n=1 Tax=Smittium angustum TaxID=133377 RepID=A0A2U1J1H6_SMIAN|nr:hypothetical protein BB558_005092 [Smittium angustum]